MSKYLYLRCSRIRVCGQRIYLVLDVNCGKMYVWVRSRSVGCEGGCLMGIDGFIVGDFIMKIRKNV